MTLIEVVAGLALMAAVLVLVFAAKGHVAGQEVRTERRTQAIAAADTLLASWWQDVNTFPRSGAGAVPDNPKLSWRTSIIANKPAESLGAQAVRLEVLGAEEAGPGGPALVSVEVVLPAPQVQPAPQIQAVPTLNKQRSR